MFNRVKEHFTLLKNDAANFEQLKESCKYELNKEERERFLSLVKKGERRNHSAGFRVAYAFLSFGILAVVLYLLGVNPDLGVGWLIGTIVCLIVFPVIAILVGTHVVNGLAEAVAYSNPFLYQMKVYKKTATHVDAHSYFITPTVAPTFYVGVSVKFYKKISVGDDVLIYKYGKSNLYYAVPMGMIVERL
ncbi:MAG: hypothetical protein FWF82_07690 [Oscillospiraceae bacterium]|nr:hypothetical protein [Oscillospiraceae bacterium]